MTLEQPIVFLDTDFVNAEKRLVEKVIKPKVSFEVRDIAGDYIICDHSIKTNKLLIGTKKYRKEFYLQKMWRGKFNTDRDYYGIIGFDFLLKHCSKWDFEKSELHL